MTACRYNPELGYRVLTRGDGDEPCPHRHCCVCWRGHCDDTNPQTCPECVGLVREDLTAVVDLHDRLEDQAVHTHSDGRLNTGPLGGDAMVMLGPYSDGGADQLARHSGDDRLGYPAWLGYAVESTLNLPNDPVPPLLVLATWEDDWRIELGHGGGPRATLWRCADYLGTHLTMMAQRHLAFDEFAADVARLRGRMEAVLHDGDREDQADVSCFECGGRLVRKVTNRGADDCWTCGKCRRRYTDPEYHLAVRAKLEAIRDQEAS